MSHLDDGPRDLDKLYKMLPTFIKGIAKGEIFGRGKPTTRPQVPCNICGVSFVPKNKEDCVPGVTFCSRCDSLLADGYTALVCDNKTRFAFIKSPHLPLRFQGKLMKVNEATMDAVQKRQKEQEDAKNASS